MPKMVACPECGGRSFFYAIGSQDTITCDFCKGSGDVTPEERAAWIAQWKAEESGRQTED